MKAGADKKQQVISTHVSLAVYAALVIVARERDMALHQLLRKIAEDYVEHRS